MEEATRQPWVTTEKFDDDEQMVILPEGADFTVQEAIEVYHDLGEVLKNLGAIEK